MPETIALTPVERFEVQTLVDNQVDLLLASAERARRPRLAGEAGAPRVETPLLAEPSLPERLVAEHGFSALVTVEAGGRTHRLLFDAGLSTGGLAHNMRVLQVALADIEAVVLSHGHFDHVVGLHGLVAEHGARRLPLLLHPDFWLERRIAPPNAEAFELPRNSRAAVQAAGFEIIEGRRPSLKRDGAWTPDPLILDDQALVVNVRGQGLVVLTGCGHAGVVNIVRHAQALTGERRIAAVIGGFHLTGGLFEPIIPATVAALVEMAPAMVVPGHCTGFSATRALSLELPEAFVQPSVGTRYIVAAAA